MLEIISGTAPESLKNLPAPDAIFVGGGLAVQELQTSGNLMDTCWKALKPGGRLVANSVTLESEQQLLKWQKINGGDLSRLNLSHAESIGKFQGWESLRPVTQLSVIKNY